MAHDILFSFLIYHIYIYYYNNVIFSVFLFWLFYTLGIRTYKFINCSIYFPCFGWNMKRKRLDYWLTFLTQQAYLNCLGNKNNIEQKQLRLFIKFGSYFQTFLSLGTTISNRPNNERMKTVLKSFSVSIPVPSQANVDKKGDERLHKLIYPSNYILLHGLPSKEWRVWTSLIIIQKVFDALGWLIIHYPLYKDIHLPDILFYRYYKYNINVCVMCF